MHEGCIGEVHLEAAPLKLRPDLLAVGASISRAAFKRLSLYSTLVVTAFAVELCFRLILGFGDPPLYQSDPKIEYLLRSSHTYHPFHHLVHINAYAMRSDDFPRIKRNVEELRILVVGDSVVFAGSQIDQSDISTEVVKRKLTSDLHRPIIVANISAKSWGPPNQLEYLKRFGLFSADIVVYVLNSHDYADVPTFRPTVGVDPDYPDHTPLLASIEVLRRYVPRYLPVYFRAAGPDYVDHPRPGDIRQALSAERELIKLVKQSGAKIFLAQMLEKNELGGYSKTGHDQIRSIGLAEQIPVLQVGDLFDSALKGGNDPYLDNIHPNKLGCKIMGESFANFIETMWHPIPRNLHTRRH